MHDLSLFFFFNSSNEATNMGTGPEDVSDYRVHRRHSIGVEPWLHLWATLGRLFPLLSVMQVSLNNNKPRFTKKKKKKASRVTPS